MSQVKHFYQKVTQSLHSSWVFYTTIWGIISGIVFGSILKVTFFSNILWLAVAISMFGFALYRSSFIMITVAFIAGSIIGSYRIVSEINSRANFAQLAGETITVSGKITEDPIVSSGTVKLHLNHLQVNLPRDDLVENSVEKSQDLAGTVYVQLPKPHIELERSDEITITGKVGAGFGIYIATFYRPELITVTRAVTGDIFARLKHWFADQVRSSIPSPAVDLGLGYLMGMKSGLSDSFSDALSTVGMTHVVVASGAHLGILVSAAKKLFGKLSKFAGLLFSLLLTLGFVLVVGFTPSMTRAALVTSLSLLVGYVGRKFTPFRLLSLVAALTLLLVPTNFQNLGWQLSFASFFGIMVLAPHLQKLLYGGKKPPWLASMLITSVSTSLICAPILIYNFGSLSFLSFVANLIILPTLPYAMLLIFLTGSFSFCITIAQLIGQIATYLLDFHIFTINFLSTQRMLVLELPSNDPKIYLLYLPVILFLIYRPILQYLRRFHREIHQYRQPNSPP